MKFGVNLCLWADDMHDGLLPVLERLKQIGYDGVEVPIFDLDQAKWALWARRLDRHIGEAYAFLEGSWSRAGWHA
jgi:D-psicose/D-tagatose/L-ribulose 3-epimerase